MWIPNPVYEVLPPVYGTAGIATMAYSFEPVSVVSGLLLVCAGLTVWWQRRDARRGDETVQRKSSRHRTGNRQQRRRRPARM